MTFTNNIPLFKLHYHCFYCIFKQKNAALEHKRLISKTFFISNTNLLTLQGANCTQLDFPFPVWWMNKKKKLFWYFLTSLSKGKMLLQKIELKMQNGSVYNQIGNWTPVTCGRGHHFVYFSTSMFAC